MNKVYSKFKNTVFFNEALKHIRSASNISLCGLPQSAKSLFVATLAMESKQPIIYVLPNTKNALEAYQECLLLENEDCYFLPPMDLQFISGIKGKDFLWKRLTALDAIKSKKCKILCIPSDVLMTKFQAPHKWITHTIHKDESYHLMQLLQTLLELGYQRVEKVEEKGEFALRGDILDIFPPTTNEPYRIEFFDNTVDSIRSFDLINQRSLDYCLAVTITQARDFVLNKNSAKIAYTRFQEAIYNANKIRSAMVGGEQILSDEAFALPSIEERMFLYCEKLKVGEYFEGMNMFSNIIFNDLVPIEQYFGAPIIIFEQFDSCMQNIEDRQEGYFNDLNNALERNAALKEQETLLFSPDEVRCRFSQTSLILFDSFERNHSDLSNVHSIHFIGKEFEEYKNKQETLVKYIASKTFDTIILMSPSAHKAEKILSLFGENNISRSKVTLVPKGLHHGFALSDDSFLLLSENDFFETQSFSKTKKQKKFPGQKLDAFTDLNPNDYVVHEMHGIGIYRGVKRIKADDVEKDYLLIDYRGTDQLYVPIEQFDRVQKYIGSHGDAPVLSSLGSDEFLNKKKKVKQSLKKLAFDLVKLYASRQAVSGVPLLPSCDFESQFNDLFQYELTEDQDTAIHEVLADMESPHNMDRLICGDVGYGKTEVAMRAAFRAVINGKQVAMLAPTTILVQQHYNNFVKRFLSFPVRIASLSRFHSAKQNKQVVKEINEGNIDIVIGTHKMLSKDVRYKNLGLLIVDEEQRFGVAHKEQIKVLKNNIDVLTLSATPIPRTLHMSLVGVRDMSVLETPPENRIPVQTYIVEHSDSLIRDAVMRELNRNGQVFFLYNRVKDIDAFAIKLKKLLPNAKIAVAHGQMSSNALEDIMLDFSEGNFDVLLCTTIIENGIDIPNANTLIVYNADHLGLSQLYQLRGRVGRSSTLAYAYFTVRPNKLLNETAEKRLRAIKEFTSFGAGFKIAMRDLEIRGAGDIFGAEQSGQISQIGYDLYCKLIEEAVKEAQGDYRHVNESELETRVELHISAFIPTDYIADERQRIEIYKKISFVKTDEDGMQIIDELIDRFGDPPDVLLNLIDIAKLKYLCNDIGCEMFSYFDGCLYLRLNANFIREPDIFVEAVKQSEYNYLFSKSKTPTLILKTDIIAKAKLMDFSLNALKDLKNKITALSSQKC